MENMEGTFRGLWLQVRLKTLEGSEEGVCREETKMRVGLKRHLQPTPIESINSTAQEYTR
jgi:hypothetical protein